MTCTCKKDLEAKLLEVFQNKEPSAANHEAKLQGYTFVFTDDNRMKLQGCMQANLKACYTAKNGNQRDKTTKTSMLFTYCPFCGVAYDKPAVDTSPGVIPVPVPFLQQLQADLWQVLEDEPILGLGALPANIDTINALLESNPSQDPLEGD
jgi:hypothetical protein